MRLSIETKEKLGILKEYLEKWDWEIAPLFMCTEKDARALLELINGYNEDIAKRAARYIREGKE